MPGYQQYLKVSQEIPGAIKLGALGVTWSPRRQVVRLHQRRQALPLRRRGEDARARSASRMRRPAGAGSAAPADAAAAAGRTGARPAVRLGRFARRQAEGVLSRSQPVAQRRRRRRARSRSPPTAATRSAIKYGTASWVYGEELGQRTAMWWSPDSRKVAYYRFDEKPVPDYHLQLDQTQIQSKVDVEAYPKAGAPNPIVDLFVYDVASKKSVKVDVRNGKPFDNAVVGHYVYRVAWSPDGTRAALQPHQPQAEHPRARRRQPRHRRDARGDPRGVADRLGREQPDDDVPEGWQAIHLGVGAQRLEQPLSLRPERQADRAADGAHRLRGRDRCSRSTKRRGCCSTPRATATTT